MSYAIISLGGKQYRVSEGQRLLVDRLTTPRAVQRWLRSLPYNWEKRGETLRSFRSVVFGLRLASCSVPFCRALRASSA